MAKKFDFKKIGIRVGGSVAGGVVGRFADKPLANMNPKIRSIIKIGVGAILPELAPKSDFLGSVGAGLTGVGGADLFDTMVNKTAPVSGIGTDFDMALGATEDYDVNGIGEDENALSGIGEDETY
jgi:hypothetical protein